MTRVAQRFGILALFLALTPFLTTTQSQDINEAIKLTRSEQFNAADKLFNNLLVSNPSDGDVYFYYGDNFLKRYFADTLNTSLGEMADQAKTLFTKGIQAEPVNPINYAGMAEVALMLKNKSEAQQYLDKAYSLLPTRKNKIQMTPERHAHSLVKMADAFVMARVKDTTQIFQYLREAEKVNSRDIDIYLVRGDAYIYLLNDGSNAIANYNIVKSLNPNSSMANLRIGQLWMRAKQYQMALDQYEEGVKIDSTFAPAYRELGFLLSKAGRYAEAKKMFRKFLELSAGNIPARLQFINTLMELQDYPEAITEINEVLSMDTTIIDLYRARAYALYENEEFENGLKAIKKFFKRSPEDKIRATDYIYYGRLLSKNDMDSLAAPVLYHAWEMDTSKYELLSEVAMSYIKYKDYADAIRIYALKDSINEANVLDVYNWAKAYYNIQDYANAAAKFERFCEAQPTYVPGFTWWARTLFNLDPESDEGLAKPVYEQILVITMDDTVKQQKARLEAYYYLAYYYYHQYVLDKKDLDLARESLKYNNSVLAIDPENEKAKQMVEALKRVVK
ncbi:MAG: tetratricopeptide repeat protein [Bacteroidales bacterium]|nr:tetratricopeptide repeat protein [Bacteroidales bacterium]